MVPPQIVDTWDAPSNVTASVIPHVFIFHGCRIVNAVWSFFYQYPKKLTSQSGLSVLNRCLKLMIIY